MIDLREYCGYPLWLIENLEREPQESSSAYD